ncbi:hypothetical protein [Paenibacillus tepidiphilus]|uniref:hypothetical protein n=1 Tax=Paenibacillus tepidiphilus TaxID=2608683 RepID=UPI001238CB96|nr:hypothetical protein [Paenibacillus tepidiphilus]
MKRCTACILPDTFPGIRFDESGVCQYCLEAGEGNQPFAGESLKDKLETIIRDNRGHGRTYDALVAYSGGKDSTYLIHRLQSAYQLSILAVTFDNGYMSEASFRNMRTVLGRLNVDHLIVRPGQSSMNRIFAQSCGHRMYPDHLTKFGSGICISCIRMVSTMALRVAIEKGIPMVMLGNSPGQMIQSENELIFRDNTIPYALRRRLFKPLVDQLGDERLYDLLMLTREEYKTKPFPYTINPFPILGYDEQLIYREIAALGWSKPTDVDPNSTNCKLNSLGIKKHCETYHFHPYDFEMSMLVRQKIISRDEAIRRVSDPERITEVLAAEVEAALGELVPEW